MTPRIKPQEIQKMFDTRIGAAAGPCQQAKNSAIEESLDTLSRAIGQLKCLHEEISAGPCCSEAKNPEACPPPMRPLESLLDDLPVDISKFASRVSEITDEMRKALI